jgi:hypothetical protein
VKQDPAHLTRSAELFEQLIARSPNRSSARDMSAPRIRFLLARMYARNGLGEKAIVEARRALDEMQSWPADDRCVESNIALIALAQELRDHDQASAAGELPANDGVLGLLSCMSAPEERSDSRALQG